MSRTETSSDFSGQVAITGVGMVTPVGLTAEVAAASMRAGISRLTELPYLDIAVDENEFAPVIGAEVPVLGEARRGADKLARLLVRSLEDALSDSQLESGQVQILLGVAHDRPAERELSQRALLERAVREALPSGLAVGQVDTIAAGRAAALQAIRMAATSIAEGRTAAALAGGVDSWATPRSLSWLHDEGRLREHPRKTGILPGEAAGIVVLESATHARSRNARVQAMLTAAAGRMDQRPEGAPHDGRALGQAIAAAVRGVSDSHALVISDLNGERYRAHEWMLAAAKGMWRYETLRHWHPAEYIGDSGAASGAISTGWAAKSLRRGYAKADRVLVWGGSDEGAREALVISRAVGV